MTKIIHISVEVPCSEWCNGCKHLLRDAASNPWCVVLQTSLDNDEENIYKDNACADADEV